jgi:hypothetical protein
MLPGTFEWETEDESCKQNFTIGTKTFKMVQFHLHSGETPFLTLCLPLHDCIHWVGAWRLGIDACDNVCFSYSRAHGERHVLSGKQEYGLNVGT